MARQKAELEAETEEEEVAYTASYSLFRFGLNLWKWRQL
jgi:hypothetical protein